MCFQLQTVLLLFENVSARKLCHGDGIILLGPKLLRRFQLEIKDNFLVTPEKNAQSLQVAAFSCRHFELLSEVKQINPACTRHYYKYSTATECVTKLTSLNH